MANEHEHLHGHDHGNGHNHAHDHEHDHEHAHAGHEAGGAGYEVVDANVREIVFTGIGLLVGTVIVCFAVAGLVKVLNSTEGEDRLPVTEVATQAQFPPSPRLQSKPWEELQVLRKNENQALTSYGWTNKDAGKVRIPIERAMDLVVQHGLPVRAGSPASQAGTGTSKTGLNEGNVPSQATGYPSKAGVKANAAKQ